MKLQLNKRLVEGLEPSADRYYIHDARQPGLSVAVHPSGEKSFVFLKKLHGRSRRLTIGKFPQVTVEIARKKAQQFVADIARGGDPFQERAEKRHADTLGGRWQSFLDDHVIPHCRPTTAQGYRYAWQHLEQWQNRKIHDIAEDEIRRWHVKLGQESPYAANRALTLLSSLFTHRNKNGPNPCKEIERFREESRDRYLQPEEMKPFLEALDREENQTFADCIRLMLFTGCRQADVCEMKWEHISLESRTWRIPRTKNNQPLTVPLTEAAMEVLARRKEASESQWVLPGKSPLGHITKPKSSWHRFLERAGIKNLRMHDLRRTFGSWQAAGGTSLHLIGKSLGHRSGKSTSVYAHVNLDPVRQSVEVATQAMLEAAKGGEK